MGLSLLQLDKAGLYSDTTDMNLSTGWVWIVFRLDKALNAKGNNDVHLQGVFDDEEKARESCTDETYIIGPVPINTALPERRIEWVGSYFPRK